MAILHNNCRYESFDITVISPDYISEVEYSYSNTVRLCSMCACMCGVTCNNYQKVSRERVHQIVDRIRSKQEALSSSASPEAFGGQNYVFHHTDHAHVADHGRGEGFTSHFAWEGFYAAFFER